MIQRQIKSIIENNFFKNKAIVIIGARQVGKTTLIKEIINQKNFLFLDADDPITRKLLTNPSTETLKSIVGNHTFVFIDEAQRIKNIGITLKIIVDQIKDIQLLVSGSSSFEIGNLINEPLTGRKWEYILYPISWQEYQDNIGYLKAEQALENRLLYGFYPDVLNNVGNERNILQQLVSSYLYRDVLSLSEIRKPEVLEKLIQALAFQIGSEVNYNELATIVGINKQTVQHYIQLLEQSFIVFRVPSFSRNLRNEIKHAKKIYFYDVGVRNAIINNFNPLDLRNDKGALWENFLIAERLKQNQYNQNYAKLYFWRTKQQQEIDLIEEVNGKLFSFEFKWKLTKKNISKTFTDAYTSEVAFIDRTNFREFIGAK